MFINYDPGMTLTYFTARSTYRSSMHCHLKGKTCREWANGLKIYDSEKIWTPGVCPPTPGGNIHDYYAPVICNYCPTPPTGKGGGQSG